jgi:phytoene dehydrogenase-like protein
MRREASRAVVIGSGPNGLAAAITLARAGMSVEVFEAEQIPGGAARTLELTLPGFQHDFGSAVHPMAASSPFFTSLGLQQYGLDWIHSPSALAHPFDDGSAISLERDLDAAARVMQQDGETWKRIVRPLVEHWDVVAPELLSPLTRVPKHPLLLARFGLRAVLPARALANGYFKNWRTKALFAGLAAHSFLSLDDPLSAAIGIVLGATAHVVGWPIPRGGAQSITTALLRCLENQGGRIHTSARVEDIGSLEEFQLAMCDVTPRQLIRIAGERFTPAYTRSLSRYQYGPGVFKVDYALNAPIPWTAVECTRAATVHLGGTLNEIAASEDAMRHGRHAERPFVLLAQPTLFDPTRAPMGKHIAWAYCHVPHGSDVDMLDRLEAQIERFAPGFRDCILARGVLKPVDLERCDANLVGGDINGGDASVSQFIFRPTWRQYSTSDQQIYICSSSTPPGGGVHGMCGYNAALVALARRLNLG